MLLVRLHSTQRFAPVRSLYLPLVAAIFSTEDSAFPKIEDRRYQNLDELLFIDVTAAMPNERD